MSWDKVGKLLVAVLIGLIGCHYGLASGRNAQAVGQATTAGFAIDTKHVQTQVLVENGGTVSIGGIFEEIERTDDTKVPFLGDLPGLGWLFRNRSRSNSKSEMMVFITPKVLVGAASAP